MQFNLVNKKEMPVFHNGALCLGVNSFIRTCTASSRSRGPSVVVMLGECCVAFVLWRFSAFSLFFCFPLSTPPFFFTFITVWRVPWCLCVGAHFWVAGIASHGSVLPSRGWLITMKTPGQLGHPPSTQLDAVVNQEHWKHSRYSAWF